MSTFACSTGAPYEDDVEHWIQTAAIGWLNDVPRAVFQRRRLVLVEDESSLVAIAAWQDIVRVDLEGIWLQVLAVVTDAQHRGVGDRAYDLVLDRMRSGERDGDHLAGLVHPDNDRSKRLLTRRGWTKTAELAGHELWTGVLP